MNGYQHNEILQITNWTSPALIQQMNIALWYMTIFVSNKNILIEQLQKN